MFVTILKVAEEQPGLVTRDMAGVLGVSKQLLNYHIRALQLQGMMHSERSGLSTRHFREKAGVVIRETPGPQNT